MYKDLETILHMYSSGIKFQVNKQNQISIRKEELKKGKMCYRRNMSTIKSMK